MKKLVKCKDCKAIKDWAFQQNCCAFCGVTCKTVKADDTCPEGKERKVD